MSTDAKQLLQEKMAQDPAFAAAVKAAATPADLARVAAAHGITLPAPDAALSDTDLDGVAGGAASSVVSVSCICV